MYFLRGSLPWQGLASNNKKDKYTKIMEKKIATPPEELCRNHPAEFATYLDYCRGLQFDDRPDYAHLRRQFKDLFFREKHQCDFIFDWTVVNHQSRASRHVEEQEAPEKQAKEEGDILGAQRDCRQEHVAARTSAWQLLSLE